MSSLTRQAAVDEILALFKTVWDTTGYQVKYDNFGNKSTPPDTQDPWARVMLRHVSSEQATIQTGPGNRRFRREGLLTVQTFQPSGEGGAMGNEDLGTLVRDAYEGVTSAGGVIFRKVNVMEIGQDGDFFQTNITAEFEYDELK